MKLKYKEDKNFRVYPFNNMLELIENKIYDLANRQV